MIVNKVSFIRRPKHIELIKSYNSPSKIRRRDFKICRWCNFKVLYFIRTCVFLAPILTVIVCSKTKIQLGLKYHKKSLLVCYLHRAENCMERGTQLQGVRSRLRMYRMLARSSLYNPRWFVWLTYPYLNMCDIS